MRVISRKEQEKGRGKKKRQDHLTDLLKRFSIKFLTLPAIKDTNERRKEAAADSEKGAQTWKMSSV